MTGGGSVAGVTNKGDGTYTATYTAGAAAGQVKIEAKTDNGKVATFTLTLTEKAEPSVATTIALSAQPTSLEANGTSTATLTATVKDQRGNPFSTATVTFTVTSGGGTVSGVTNKGDGTYTATYTAGAAAGQVTIEAKTDNGKVTTATLTLTEKKLSPTFTVSALKTEQIAKAGAFVTYLITLEGKNGFADKVSLFASELPANVEAAFNPKEVSISAAEPLVTSQLTLTLPAAMNPGDYPFTVLARATGGESHTLSLKLTIETSKLSPTSLTLLTRPKEVAFMEPLEVLGQLTLLADPPVAVSGLTVSLTFTAPSQKTQTFETKTDAGGNYELSTWFVPNEVGEWKIGVQFGGSGTLSSAKRETTFTVTKGKTQLTFTTGPTGALGTDIELIGTLSPPLKGQPLSLKILRPDGSASTLTSIVTEEAGGFRHKVKFDAPGNWEFTATWAGNATYESGSQTLKVTVSAEVGKAIIVLGGGDQQNNKDWERFNGLAEYVHAIHRKRQFDDVNDIHFLSPDPTRTKGADTETSLNNLQLAITSWAKARVNPQVPLYLYLLSHNLGEQFLLTKRGNDETFLSPALLNEWLNQRQFDVRKIGQKNSNVALILRFRW